MGTPMGYFGPSMGRKELVRMSYIQAVGFMYCLKESSCSIDLKMVSRDFVILKRVNFNLFILV